jgi:hypothetical protein
MCGKEKQSYQRPFHARRTVPTFATRRKQKASANILLRDWRRIVDSGLRCSYISRRRRKSGCELRWTPHGRKGLPKAGPRMAEAITRLDPNRSDAWVHRSFALHEMKRAQELSINCSRWEKAQWPG